MSSTHHGSPPDDRHIVWFDIDNTLYSANAKIAEAMTERIQGRSHVRSFMFSLSRFLFSAYFKSLDIGPLHQDYYLTYGLALRGLLRHHQVGEFNVYLSVQLDHLIFYFNRSIRF
jgi:pyrimidine and pyridine-specific 5'-nucleotidase